MTRTQFRRGSFVAAIGLSLVALAALAPGAAQADPGALFATQPGDAQPLQSPAEETLNVELLVLHATNDGKGIDKGLEDMPELKRPPFSSYNSYKVLKREKVALKMGSSDKRKLPNDRQLLMSYKAKKAEKHTISVAIQKPNGGEDYLPVLEVNGRKGERFFVAGQAYQGGILVIGLKILP
jgi:hypothetical protein